MESKLIFELSRENRVGYSLPDNEIDYPLNLPGSFLRTKPCNMPEVSELDVVRHFTNLSRKNYGVEQGFYPLGSCTMKYNPKINDEMAGLKKATSIHPLQPEGASQGSLEIYHNVVKGLCEVTGMEDFSLNPFAGAHGELIGLMIMKEYHLQRNDTKRTKVIVPDSAHGTNPASVTVCNMEAIEVKSNKDGRVSIEDLKSLLSDEVAGIMLTNPNTLGIFEKDILEIAKLVHECGGLLYYDGANLNSLLGVARPGDMGFDIIHLNLHKTFSTPHGGGGPGSGPVGVCKKLVDLLPNPQVKRKDDGYHFIDNPKSIGRISGFYGNFLVYLRAYSYFLTLGQDQMKHIGPLAVLNANYIRASLKDVYQEINSAKCMHEVVFDGLKSKSVRTLDVAKRLLDYGYHPPTIYFPLLYPESMMIEPTEVESKETLDGFIDAMLKIAQEAETDPEMVKHAPYNTIVRRLDEATAARKPILKFQDITK